MVVLRNLALCLCLLSVEVLAAPKIWTEWQGRGGYTLHIDRLLAQMTDDVVELLEWHVQQIGINVGDTITDIDAVLRGYNPGLAGQLYQVLRDDAYYTKLRRARQRFSVAKSVLNQGTSQDSAATWYGRNAAGGVVRSLVNLLLSII